MVEFLLLGAGKIIKRKTAVDAGWPIFWTVAPVDGLDLTLTIETLDTNPVNIDWGDDTIEEITHNVSKTHTYSAGTYSIRIETPANIDTITTDDDDTDKNGTVLNADLAGMTELYIKRCNVATITLSPATSLEILYCNGNALTALDTSANTSLTYIYCVNNPSLTAIDVGNNSGLTSLYCSQCNLSASTIDQILIDLDSFGTSSGTIDFSTNTGSSDAYRSSAALTAKTNLLARGWTITTGVSGTVLWTVDSVAGDTAALTVTSTDGESIVVDWGDDTYEMLSSGVEATHTYGTAASTLRVFEPARILSIVDSNATKDLNGSIDTTNFTGMTTLKVRKSGLTEIVVPSTTLITDLEVESNGLDETEIGGTLINLDTAGNSSGIIKYEDNASTVWSNFSSIAQASYDSLVEKSWTITPVRPSSFYTVSPVTPPVFFLDFEGDFVEGISGETYTTLVDVNLATGQGKFDDGAMYFSTSATGIQKLEYSNATILANCTHNFQTTPLTISGWTMSPNASDYGKILNVEIYRESRYIHAYVNIASGTMQAKLSAYQYTTGSYSGTWGTVTVSNNTYYHWFVAHDPSTGKAYVGIDGTIKVVESATTNRFTDFTSYALSKIALSCNSTLANTKYHDDIAIHASLPFVTPGVSPSVGDAYTVPTAPY